RAVPLNTHFDFVCCALSRATYLTRVAIPVVHPIVCLHGAGDHRHLHAFPTRRSSDLLGLQPVLQRLAGRRVGPGAALGVHQARRDRKSTRLNSSHVKTSYAVFCLKKKKTYRPRATLSACLSHIVPMLSPSRCSTPRVV